MGVLIKQIKIPATLRQKDFSRNSMILSGKYFKKTPTKKAAEISCYKHFNGLFIFSPISVSGNNDLHHLQYIPMMASFSYKAHALGGIAPKQLQLSSLEAACKFLQTAGKEVIYMSTYEKILVILYITELFIKILSHINQKK